MNRGHGTSIVTTGGRICESSVEFEADFDLDEEEDE